ncbi:CapA family protein [Cellulomonas sp. KRMCY2]|uniref:CapA family protein n=1 Tax=Cellulomonas sp. KRMCY2 TaxID=1304865 RepID=UPI0004B13F3B|nr:CapA family protein [Cellulomonas sp. KRMCY2]
MTRHSRSDAPRPALGRALAVVVTLLVAGAAGAAAFAGLPLAAGHSDQPAGEPRPAAAEPTRSPTPTPTPTPTRPPDAVFTLVAAGDVLLHEPVIGSARTADGYDFAPLLAPIQPWVAGADLALCHLEVPIAPPGTPTSGYPMFGAPVEITASLAANGWDGCSTASNHSVDRGLAGVVTTLDALDAAGLGHVGTARTAEEAAAPAGV